MATEGCRCTGRKNPEMMRKSEIDEELTDIRAEMEKLTFWMQHNTRSRWVYEWPMRKSKAKWSVKELMSRRQRRLLRRWLRHAEKLNRPEERVHICEPETGRNLSDDEDEMGSAEDLKHCQEGREEIPDFQVGKELRSTKDLTDCHEDSQGISHCQVGNGTISLRDLTDCQEGNSKFPVCQVGKGIEMGLSESLMDSEMSSIQPKVLIKMGSVDLIVYQGSSRKIPYYQVGRDKQVRLCESLMNSEVSLDQQMQLTKEEDLRNLLMIGGIQIFLPLSLEEAKVCVADEATTSRERQLAETVKEELEQVFETAQVEKEDEHSKEWPNTFSQEAKKTIAFELAEEEEEEDNIGLADLYEKIEALERRVKV
jgi:hypothetical protein